MMAFLMELSMFSNSLVVFFPEIKYNVMKEITKIISSSIYVPSVWYYSPLFYHLKACEY